MSETSTIESGGTLENCVIHRGRSVVSHLTNCPFDSPLTVSIQAETAWYTISASAYITRTGTDVSVVVPAHACEFNLYREKTRRVEADQASVNGRLSPSFNLRAVVMATGGLDLV
jgi:hypothetical protein